MTARNKNKKLYKYIINKIYIYEKILVLLFVFLYLYIYIFVVFISCCLLFVVVVAVFKITFFKISKDLKINSTKTS